MPAPLPSSNGHEDTSSATADVRVLLTGVGLASLDEMAWIRVTGSDRVRWLNGMVTNSILALKPGEGCYNFVLNAQGRIRGDLTAFLLHDEILLETASTQAEALTSLLDQFIIMDDVELTPVRELRGLLVAGPAAASALQTAGLDPGAIEAEHLRLTNWATESGGVAIVHAFSPVVPRFELWGEPAALESVRGALVAERAVPVGAKAVEQLRILEGTPQYGTEIRDRDLPQETNQGRALHFNKGCYLGQEIVERIRSRGQVHRTFTGFRLTGTLPGAGAVLEADGKPVGELTSVAAMDHPAAGSMQLGLGYIRREALERGSGITYPGGEAVPVSLPFDPK